MLESLINRITRASLRFKWLTIGLSVFAIAAGVYSLTQLNQELIPGIEFPQIFIFGQNPGIEPDVLRDEVTIPIEQALGEIEGVVNMESRTSSASVVFILLSEFGTDLEELRNEIESALDGLSYPDGMEAPTLPRFSFADLPVAAVSVSSEGLSLDELKDLVEAEIIPALEELPRVEEVEVSGGQELPSESSSAPEPTPVPTETPTEEEGEGPVALPESWITMAAGLGQPISTTEDLINNPLGGAAELLNMMASLAPPELYGDLTIGMIAWLADAEEGFLENLDQEVLKKLSPSVLLNLPEDFYESMDPDLRAELEGIASGTVEVFVLTETINRTDGNPSLTLTIFKDSEANTVSVSHVIFDSLDDLKAEHSGLRFDVVFEQASFIEESIDGVTREGSLGAVFAVVVILFFLSGVVKGRYRLSWRSTIVTAVSIPLSVFMAFAMLKWLPQLTEYLFDPLDNLLGGVPVIGPLVSATHRLFPVGLTLNIMTLSGMTVAIGRVVDDSIVVLENIYRHIQRGRDLQESVLQGTRDVAIAIFASTVTTVIVFLPIGLLGGLIGEFFLPFGVAVSYALAASFLVAVTIVPLLAFMFIRKEHLPEERETGLQKFYTPILEWSLKHRGLTLLFAALLFFGSMFLLAQRPRAFLPNMGEVSISASIDLPNGTSMEETLEKVISFEDALNEIDGIGVVQAGIGSIGSFSMGPGQGLGENLANVSIAIEDTLDPVVVTELIRSEAHEIFGEENVVVSSGTMSSGAFGGFSIILSGEVEDLGEVHDEVIALLNNVDGIANASSNLADASMILRVDGRPAVAFTGEMETVDTLGVTSAAIAEVELLVPESLTVSEGFETQQQTQGFAQAMQAIIISIIAVYLILVVTFRSLVHPFTILFSLPLAIIGAAVALTITNRVLGLSVMVGLMMLVGIVVTNAIVLIDRVQANRKKRGMSTYDALVEGGRTRLRPILMTAIAAMLALVPLAMGFTQGALIAAELATVVIGGLFSSTFLTLMVVPVMYSVLAQLTEKKQKDDA
ncbi:MAG: efflux RND transporter permease subunit [Chloroflexi bacterium]|nr:efflux RND transporter permease subunit [Chloroflexota bacterium]